MVNKNMNPEFKIRRAQNEDYKGILKLVQQVWGLEDFITAQLQGWIVNTAVNCPLIAMEQTTEEYAAIGNVKKIGDYAWLEGLRIDPKYRGYKLANTMTETLLQEIRVWDIVAIGYATGYENQPMHNVAKKMGFLRIGQQLVVYKELDQHEQTQRHQITVKSINSRLKFQEFMKKHYNSEIITSFSKLPSNKVGKQILDNIPIYETEKSYLLHEKNHNEATKDRGIFTIYLKKEFNIKIMEEEMTYYEKTNVVTGYKAYSFSTPVKEEEVREIKSQLEGNSTIEAHFLIFYEKKNVDLKFNV